MKELGDRYLLNNDAGIIIEKPILQSDFYDEKYKDILKYNENLCKKLMNN